MERLITELFECEGYTARVLSKTSFKGSADADIEAEHDDSFTSYTIYAQVKHHVGYSGRKGIDQIIKAIEERNSNGEECKGVFITTALVTEDNQKYAENNGIIVIDGNSIVDIIVSNINKLSEDTVNKLGIVMVPSILN